MRVRRPPLPRSPRPKGRSVAVWRAAMSGAEPIFDPWDEYVVPPFPLEVLSDDVRRFVETQSRVIGCDPSAVAMSVLAACSGALDHRFALRSAQRRLVRTPAPVGSARRRSEPKEDAGDRGGHTLPWGTRTVALGRLGEGKGERASGGPEGA